jgi:hypothetical protein
MMQQLDPPQISQRQANLWVHSEGIQFFEFVFLEPGMIVGLLWDYAMSFPLKITEHQML